MSRGMGPRVRGTTVQAMTRATRRELDMAKVKAYEALAQAFVSEGVDTLFTLMGDANGARHSARSAAADGRAAERVSAVRDFTAVDGWHSAQPAAGCRGGAAPARGEPPSLHRWPWRRGCRCRRTGGAVRGAMRRAA